jgi:hypothetical protein
VSITWRAVMSIKIPGGGDLVNGPGWLRTKTFSALAGRRWVHFTTETRFPKKSGRVIRRYKWGGACGRERYPRPSGGAAKPQGLRIPPPLRQLVPESETRVLSELAFRPAIIHNLDHEPVAATTGEVQRM